MNATLPFTLMEHTLHMMGSGAVWWPDRRMLIVSDLHLGKSERMARRGGPMLPPYEVTETLARLARDVALADPDRVICLGDSLDDNAARAGVDAAAAQVMRRMQAGRDWVWIAGNHDPAPSDLGGMACTALTVGALTFRHIAVPGAQGELSGHYHPKVTLPLRGRMIRRPCLLHDSSRAILPAYGTYTGGLDWSAPVLRDLFPDGGCALLTGNPPHALPIPRRRAASARRRSG